MTQATKLYWWRDQPNFGDALSPLLLEYVTGNRVEWAEIKDADVVGLGSIMRPVRRAFANNRRENLPVLWGTGTIGPVRTDFLANVDIASLRGPLTASVLGKDLASIGDPGILSNRVFSSSSIGKIKKFALGVVPHLTQLESPAVKALSQNEHVTLIDPRNDDPEAVVSLISDCEVIASSSLHGLIIADCFNIPNVWLEGRNIHGTPRFKFYDYFLSVGRTQINPVPWLGLTPDAIQKYVANINTSYFSVVHDLADKVERVLHGRF